jgi:hypothetical protein
MKEVKFQRNFRDYVALTLASWNVPFRGHREGFDKLDSGNFRFIIQLLAEYESVLAKLLEKKEGQIKYCSPKIQNEVINVIAGKLKAKLLMT